MENILKGFGGGIPCKEPCFPWPMAGLFYFEGEIFKYPNGHRFLKGVFLYGFFLEQVNGNALPDGVHNPIFFYAGGAVFEQFCEIVHWLAAWGNDFNRPVWGSIAAFFRD